jgi:hypothetical protein
LPEVPKVARINAGVRGVLEDMKRDELLATRADIESCAFLAMAMEDETGISTDAADLYHELSNLLLYQSPGADGTRSIRLIPVSFRWPHFYRDMVAELLTDLGEDAVSDESGRVALVKHAAELTDCDLYSADFRLSCLDVLNELLDGLKRAAEDDELVET